MDKAIAGTSRKISFFILVLLLLVLFVLPEGRDKDYQKHDQSKEGVVGVGGRSEVPSSQTDIDPVGEVLYPVSGREVGDDEIIDGECESKQGPGDDAGFDRRNDDLP